MQHVENGFRGFRPASVPDRSDSHALGVRYIREVFAGVDAVWNDRHDGAAPFGLYRLPKVIGDHNLGPRPSPSFEHEFPCLRGTLYVLYLHTACVGKSGDITGCPGTDGDQKVVTTNDGGCESAEGPLPSGESPQPIGGITMARPYVQRSKQIANAQGGRAVQNRHVVAARY
jgi:hypothetical protein